MSNTPSVPGALNVSNLSGNEIVAIATGGPTSAQTTTAAIAALASLDTSNLKITNLTTVGAGTITATGIVGGITSRSGPVGNFTDTTDTAAAIIAALPGAAGVGTSFIYRYNNTTAYVATLAGGTGVTVSGITMIPQNAWAEYLVTYSAAATLTFVGLQTGSLSEQSIVAGKVLTVNNSLTLAGTDATTQTFPATSATIARTDAAQTFTGEQTITGLLRGAVTLSTTVAADPQGVLLVASTAAKSFTLGNLTPNADVDIICTAVGTASKKVKLPGSASMYGFLSSAAGSSKAKTSLNFTGEGQAVRLRFLSSVVAQVMTKSGNVGSS